MKNEEKNNKVKINQILLKSTKYGLIVFLFLALSFSGVMIVYANKFDYTIPSVKKIEVYDSKGNLYLKMNNDNRRSYVTINNINQNIIDCFITIEDKNFYKHSGINIKRIIGAFVANVKSGGIVEGASTITQQYVKNIFLTSEKKLKRKIDEALIAIQIETKYTKDEILEGYLNTIYFDHGIYGIEDACKFYFAKSASEVSLIEAAALASIPKSPANYSPIKNPDNNKSRRELILTQMYEDNLISEDILTETLKQNIKIHGKLESIDKANAPYFQDMVINELEHLNIPSQYSEDGIKIYTTLDLSLNDIINTAIDKYYPNDEELQVALYSINPQTGAILSVLGGKNYLESTYDRTQALRQPGSSIKPFLYYEALENGFTPATTFESEKTTFYYNNEQYSPRNYGDIYPNRDVSMAYALATSDNIYAVKTHLFLGPDKMVSTLRDFGFTGKINNNVSLALGTSEVKLSELTTGYAKIASLGKDIKPYCIEYITDMDDNIIFQANNNAKQKFDLANCYILSETMTNVFDNNLSININTTCANIASLLSSKFAAKSGSTDFDNWIIGFNKNIVLGLWTGYDDNRIINNQTTRYIKYMWAYIMEKYSKLTTNNWYTTPDNVVGITVNPTTGTIPYSNEYRKKLYFKTSSLPWFIYFRESVLND